MYGIKYQMPYGCVHASKNRVDTNFVKPGYTQNKGRLHLD